MGTVGRWEYVEAGSAKFWEAAAEGPALTVRYGRIGSDGRTQVKEHPTAEAASAALAKLVAEKERKGYVAVGAAAPAAAAAPVAAGRSASAGPAVPSGPSAQAAPADVSSAAPAEPEVVIPDERTFVLPSSWRRVLHPRRGGVPRKPAAPSASAVAQFASLLAQHSAEIDACLGSEVGDARLVEAARRHLAGSPDPVGAGAVLALLPREAERLWADALVEQHGLPFAARTVVEYLDIDVVHHDHRRGRLTEPELRRIPEGQGYYAVHCRRPTAERVRALLAAADDATYRQAVEAVGRQLGTGRRRIVAAFLLPTESAWVDACCAEPGADGEQAGAVRALLMCALGSADQLRELGGNHSLGWQGWSVAMIATLAEGIGTAAVAPLASQLDQSHAYTDELRLIAKALAEFPTDEAFSALLRRADDKYVGPALQEAAARWPVRALRLMAAESLRTGSARAPIAQRLLRGQVLAHRALVEAVLPSLPEDVAAVVRPLVEATAALPDAPADALPEVLVSPPWLRPAGAGAKQRAVTGLTADAEPAAVWAPGEREQWRDTQTWYAQGWHGEQARKYDTAEVRSELTKTKASPQSAVLFAMRPEEEVRPFLDSWDPDDLWDGEELLKPVAGRFGLAALDMLVRVVPRRPAMHGALLMPFVDVRVARLMADWLVRLKSVAPLARSWFARHAEAAAGLLVPDAVGGAGAARKAAERALRLIASQRGADVVLTAATGYGPKAAAAVDALLHADPLRTALPAKLPVVGAWAEPGLLPQLPLRDGKAALPLASARHVVLMLAMSKPQEPYPGLAAVEEVCDPAALAEFGWALFEAWRLAGLPAKESWALHALGAVGDDETVRRLTPVLRVWPGAGAHHRAVEGLEVLASIGSDVALLHLHGIAQRVKFKALKAKAQEKIAEVAEGLGLTAEQLADRLVPDFGLEADGSTVVDYGTRRFTVGFDEQLRPYVLDADGKRLKDLPKPGAKDDAELAPEERKRFMALKKDVRTVSSDQVRRLEAAMVASRSWSAQEFRELFVEHPLMWHLVRRMVWECLPAEGPDGTPADAGAAAGTTAGTPAAGSARAGTAFRVAEDRTFADVEEDVFVLPEDASVRLAHPLTLGEEAVAAWSEVFADYEILQPFAQLGRAVHRLTPEEAAGSRLARFEGFTVPTTKMLGLTKRGWRRGVPQDAGVENEITKTLGDNVHLVIDLDGGIAVGAIEVIPDQKLAHVSLETVPSKSWSQQDSGLRFGDLDPVAASELLADLTDLTEGAVR
ncbi:WGR and DUF4132 domain-containing protein [Streptomyces sp. NPDC004111]|uniref:WGR and DUF4132 domain-containing protein n=1 Tax=Streptomyces sp. NPDC004111 TaxID=3364690 RepID=UPI0036A9D96E